MNSEASGLSFQLAMYRWEDDMRSARAARLRPADDEASDAIAAQYNDLVHRYNALAEAAMKAGQAADASQARVDAAEAKISLRDRELAEFKQRQAIDIYELESSREFWIKETEHYKARAFAAEGELKELRSQHE